jgi:hypothetical protein
MQPFMFSLFRSTSLAVLTFGAVSCSSGPPYRPDGNVFIEQGTKPKQSGSTQKTDPAETGSTQSPSPASDPASATTPPNSTTTPSVENPASTTVPPDKPVTDPATPATDPVKPKANLPFGTPVIGKRGFVYSPYAPDKGMVDVSDIPSGTKVECPYTKNIFRVP